MNSKIQGCGLQKEYKKVGDIAQEGTLLSFDQLKTKCFFPNQYFFRYLHVRHAFQLQFQTLRIETQPSFWVSLLQDDSISKKLLITYKELFRTTPPAVLRCRERWRMKVRNIDGEDWDDMWEKPFKHLVSIRVRLIHFYTEPTTESTAGIYLPCSVNFDKFFWSCPVIQDFWSKVLECIREILTIPIPQCHTILRMEGYNSPLEEAFPPNCVLLERSDQFYDPFLQSHIYFERLRKYILKGLAGLDGFLFHHEVE